MRQRSMALSWTRARRPRLPHGRRATHRARDTLPRAPRVRAPLARARRPSDASVPPPPSGRLFVPRRRTRSRRRAETYGAEPEPRRRPKRRSEPNRLRTVDEDTPSSARSAADLARASAPTPPRSDRASDHFLIRRRRGVRGGPAASGRRVAQHARRAYHLVDGSDRKPASNPKDHYGAGRAHADPEGTSHPLAAFGKNRVPGVQPAPFDVITGAPRASRARRHGAREGRGGAGKRSSSGAGAGGSGGDSLASTSTRGGGAFPGGGGDVSRRARAAPHPFEHPGAGRVDPRGSGRSPRRRGGRRAAPGGVGTRPRVGPEARGRGRVFARAGAPRALLEKNSPAASLVGPGGARRARGDGREASSSRFVRVRIVGIGVV